VHASGRSPKTFRRSQRRFELSKPGPYFGPGFWLGVIPAWMLRSGPRDAVRSLESELRSLSRWTVLAQDVIRHADAPSETTGIAIWGTLNADAS
jgi:hypothetical protein